MRIALDTNVLVRATPRSDGPAREVLKAIGSGPHFLITSEFILDELERVLQYPRVQSLFTPPLSQSDIMAFIQELRSVNPHGVLGMEATAGTTGVSKDPDDDPVIQTAVVAAADVLCTLDGHFYKDENVKAYCAQRGITIVTDVALLRELRD